MKPYEFDRYSLQEIYDLIESYNRKMKLESEKEMANLKKDILINSALAKQTGEYIARMFSKDSSITPLEELFPEIFKEEKSRKENIDMALYKAEMEEYAFSHNERLEKKGGII